MFVTFNSAEEANDFRLEAFDAYGYSELTSPYDRDDIIPLDGTTLHISEEVYLTTLHKRATSN